ncbi:kinase-like protein [Neolentinus lepideus HHB14362 ss-1]|uniref:Kinase-like protein n=1 Tax=Neolentinus lepideus HHB14362 ss-1 TaxID=1314782 RepID=A0A165V3Q6_9AGAM|nr:kinase-like protein [Neolentinus lepideus HHB14362 ss-1]
MPPLIITVSLNMLQRAKILYDLNEGSGVSDSFREDCETVLRKVSHKTGVLPPCLYVSITLSEEGVVANGATAHIYKDRMGDTIVVVKMFHKKQHEGGYTNVKQLKRFRREVIVWKQLNYPNILPLLGVCGSVQGVGILGLVSRFCEQGSLIDYLYENKECNQVYMLEHVAGALSYLHSHDPQIVHRDVKGGNVVISAGEPRLTDLA